MKDTLNKELKEIETQLAQLSPTVIPNNILDHMEKAMISWEDHLPIDEKIVPFNNNDTNALIDTSNPKKTTTGKSNINTWSAAAAIALIAGIAFVFSNGSSQQPQLVKSNNIIAPSTKSPTTNKVLTTSGNDINSVNSNLELSRNITHASNEGIVYVGNDKTAFKLLHIEYMEETIQKDQYGKTIIIKKPCLERIYIPIRME